MPALNPIRCVATRALDTVKTTVVWKPVFATGFEFLWLDTQEYKDAVLKKKCAVGMFKSLVV
jgi:hypothetical protein